MKLEKFSMGIGDRFGHQGKAQLTAIMKATNSNVKIVPVWNKSYREHTTIGTSPLDARNAADNAVQSLGYRNNYYLDADHIGLKNVDLFIDFCNFFTLDVADFTGKAASDDDIEQFVEKHRDKLVGTLAIEGLSAPLEITEEMVKKSASRFLLAVREAGKIYRKIAFQKGEGHFITEVSMDETDMPQTPLEMLIILAAIADEGIPAQTIAPKFTGRFNKGVDYIGDVAKFAQEFEDDLAIIKYAVKEFGLPENLKLSVHSGSDKFSIYPVINKALKKFNAGLHLKTAGTTWLEELIGLAAAGGQGLETAVDIYKKSLDRYDELALPYASVIDIDKSMLPDIETVSSWSGEEFSVALRHDQNCDAFNLHFRQLLHVGYKIAAEMGDDYIKMLEKYEDVISKNVIENIYERHIVPIFL